MLQEAGTITADASSRTRRRKPSSKTSSRNPSASRCWSISGRPGAGRASSSRPVLEKAVKAAKGKVKLVKMNIDEHPAIPGQMGIQSIPAVIAFVNGQPADGFMGALPESQVVAFLERLTKDRIGGEAQDLLEGGRRGARRRRCRRRRGDLCAASRRGQRQRAGARPVWRAPMSRPARSNRRGRRSPWCRRPSRTTPRSPRRAPRWSLPSRPRRSGRSPSSSRKSPPIRSTIRRGSIWRWRSTARASALDALEHLITIVKRDRKWNDDGARKQLVQFFDAWGPTDEATIEGRKRLSSILFA